LTELDPILPAKILRDVRELISNARRQAAVAVNMGLTVLYWRIGKRLSVEVLKNERAAYGEQIVATLSRELVAEFGRGYTEKSLRRMIQFAESFPEEEIVATLWRQLSWSHFRELLPLNQPFQREFYAEMCRIEGWSVRTCAILNNQPMGFYSAAVLVKDAQRHGLRVKAIDVQVSDWPCTIEHEADGSLSLRMGLGYAKGLRKHSAEALVASRVDEGPFRSAEDLALRVPELNRKELTLLACIGALNNA
jgi:hypothetical protein